MSCRAGSVLAEGNLLFDASFLLFDSNGAKRILDYVTKDALPQMTSPTPVGLIDPGWAKAFRQQRKFFTADFLGYARLPWQND